MLERDLPKAKRIQAEARLVRDLYIALNDEGRQRLMEMALAVNNSHYLASPETIPVSQPSKGRVRPPSLTPLPGLQETNSTGRQSSDRATTIAGFTEYVEQLLADALWRDEAENKYVANGAQHYYFIEAKQSPKQ
jgi:hypothetical protein